MLSKCSDEATQRPGSTQKTDRSIGSDFGGTMRSTPITRSCLPPVTTSPASSNKRSVGVVDQHQAVHFACGIALVTGAGTNESLYRAGFGDHDYARVQAFVER